MAVYLVVLYHSGVDPFGSGFVGVDVFFVLSGYLVTELLLRDLTGYGGVRWSRFYARRYRRLLPAAFLALMGTAVAWTLVASSAEVEESSNAFRAAFLYVANWHFIDQAADYFAADVESNPVIHFWSLAVEEQFYLLWPILLGGLYGLARRTSHPLRWVRGAVALGAVTSAGYALHLASDDLSRAYYGTDTRAYQLLAGALLALTPQAAAAMRRARLGPALAPIGLATVVGLATTWEALDPIERGIAIAVATSVLIVALEASSPAKMMRRVLAQPGVAYLGRVSYGTYLWHWPAIVVLQRETSLSAAWVAAAVVTAATALAAISHHIVEHPIRASLRLDHRHRAVIVAGLAISILSGLLLAPAVLATKSDGAVEVDWRAAKRDRPSLPDCRAEATDGCTVVRGTGPHLLLLGDSNARMYIPTFTEVARQLDLTLSLAVTPLCPWQDGVFFLKGGGACRAAKAFWYDQLVAELDPDVIVLGERPIDDPANPVELITPDGQLNRNTEAQFRSLAAASRATIDRLLGELPKVVLLEPIPIAPKADDPLLCLSSATDVASCRYDATVDATPLELTYRDQADGRTVFSLDLDRLVCPRWPTCDPVVDGLIVKRDTNHITGAFAAHLAPAVSRLLLDEGILDDPTD